MAKKHKRKTSKDMDRLIGDAPSFKKLEGKHKKEPKESKHESKSETKKSERKEEKKSPFILGLIGGIFTILIAIIILFKLRGTMEIVFGIWGLAVGIVLILSSVFLKNEEKHNLGSILLIVFSALGLITLQGLVVGPAIALIGGILSRIK